MAFLHDHINHFLHLSSFPPKIKWNSRNLSYKTSNQQESDMSNSKYKVVIQQGQPYQNQLQLRNPKNKSQSGQPPYQAFGRSSKILDRETPMSRGRPSCIRLSSPLTGEAKRELLAALSYSTSKQIPQPTMARPTRVNKKFRSFNRHSKHPLHAIVHNSSNPFNQTPNGPLLFHPIANIFYTNPSHLPQRSIA